MSDFREESTTGSRQPAVTAVDGLLPYLFALALPLVMLFVRQQLPVAFGDRPLLILFMPAVILPAMAGGLGPGLLATVVAGLCTDWFLIPPRGSLEIAAGHDLFAWGLLVGSGVLVSFMAQRLHLARRQQDCMNEELDARVAERTRELEQTKSALQSILEAAPDAVLVTDADGRIVLANAQAEADFRLTRAELIGQPVEILIPDRFRAAHAAHRTGYVADPHARAMGLGRELFGRRKDGSEFPVSVALNAFEVKEGRRVICIIRDATESRRVARAREDANRELEAFSYSVTHDLRAPLRHIDGFSKILLRSQAGKLDDMGKDLLARMVDSARHMGQIIDDMLVLSRVGRTELVLEDFDLSALAADVARQLAQTFPEHRVNLSIQPDMAAKGDPRLVRIALDNLLGNAWKFTGKTADARVEVGCELRDGVPEYFVRDNGAGFDPTYAEKLFLPFERLHTDDEFPGSGIGLATVARVVKKHGGRVRAEGQVGQGATFLFVLQS